MKRMESNTVEVDMVPLIDIVSLLLMFLIIVGDSAAFSNSVSMKLPRASEAKFEQLIVSADRITIEMQKTDVGGYSAVVNKRVYDVESELKGYLLNRIAYATAKNLIERNVDGSLNWPVKLRIPEACPMKDVEKLVSTVAAVGLSKVYYAADGSIVR